MKKLNKTPWIIAISISAIVFIILLITFNVSIIKDNSSIDSSRTDLLVIDNFSDYYHDIPADTKTNIYNNLYLTVAKNLSTDTPTNGAEIRSSAPYLLSYNRTTKIYSGDFIVDIPSVQQSYRITFDYSNNKDTVVGGYRILVTCLTTSPKIYPDFNCQDRNPDNITEAEL